MPQHPRTKETQIAYEEFKNSDSAAAKNGYFDFTNEEIVAEYTHWYIIRNRFPYDTMVRVNDMLVSKRPVGSFGELNEDEHEEYHNIIAKIGEAGTYDARIENFPKVQSVQTHIHVHLVCWHNTSN